MESTRIFEAQYIIDFTLQLLPYLLQSINIALLSVIFGSILGAVLCFMQLSNNKYMKAFAITYSYIMRCTPSIVMLFIVYYGLPKLAYALFNFDLNNLSKLVYAVLAFSLIFAAYIKEVFRSAYLSVPKGQFEAAKSCNFSRLQSFYHIILPQMQQVMLPNFTNSTVNLVKESSIAYSIGLIDLIGKSNEIIAKNFGAFGIEVYVSCLLIYFITNIVIIAIFNRLERRINRYKYA